MMREGGVGDLAVPLRLTTKLEAGAAGGGLVNRQPQATIRRKTATCARVRRRPRGRSPLVSGCVDGPACALPSEPDGTGSGAVTPFGGTSGAGYVG